MNFLHNELNWVGVRKKRVGMGEMSWVGTRVLTHDESNRG
jgi:hypothetical protein